MFQGHLYFMDIYDKRSFELDDIIKKYIANTN